MRGQVMDNVDTVDSATSHLMAASPCRGYPRVHTMDMDL
jgi:hypothetical protein